MEIFKSGLGYKRIGFEYNAKIGGCANFVYTDKFG